ncbi:hypothetical protein OUZ56_018468 [Daphnia magna]|uniref:Uncharacterized protein n=1 Tax=Daphnia magna TaxID=35525 RepID=A0ABQ9Z8Z2_9CRUS|nr:hypothetical protein OUZ56_018468 [Daphnia magna]
MEADKPKTAFVTPDGLCYSEFRPRCVPVSGEPERNVFVELKAAMAKAAQLAHLDYSKNFAS